MPLAKALLHFEPLIRRKVHQKFLAKLLRLALGSLLKLVAAWFAGLTSKALTTAQGKRELFEILFLLLACG